MKLTGLQFIKSCTDSLPKEELLRSQPIQTLKVKSELRKGFLSGAMASSNSRNNSVSNSLTKETHFCFGVFKNCCDY